jgi:hypothetical protein
LQYSHFVGSPHFNCMAKLLGYQVGFLCYFNE